MINHKISSVHTTEYEDTKFHDSEILNVRLTGKLIKYFKAPFLGEIIL